MAREQKMIAKLKNRDRLAFEQTYQKYYKLVYYISLTITKDPDLSQDIVQDTFVKFMNTIDDYEENGKLKQYLTTIARNLSLNEMKRRSKSSVLCEDDLVVSYKDPTQERTNLILTLEHTLTLEESKIVTLKIMYDYSFDEISEELNQNINTVESKYYKAMKKLKKYFKKDR